MAVVGDGLKAFLDVSDITFKEYQDLAEIEDEMVRRGKIMSRCKQISGTSDVTKEEVLEVKKMSTFEDLCAALFFACGVPGGVITFPLFLVAIGFITQSSRLALALGLIVLIPLTILPVHFNKKALSSWISFQVLRYFSFKVIFCEYCKPNRATILVAPPHGVFPFGNIVTILAYPSITGECVRGLTATAALKTPLFRQVLGTFGLIDASAPSAIKALQNNEIIGISTGGVAEVFETNSPTGDQVIILKSRKGIVKLALKTGADLVPCYLFGNTELLSLYTGGPDWHNFFREFSRKIGFACIVFWGRLGLPVPYRVPILGVMAPVIPVEKTESPTQEDIDKLHDKLMESMKKLFDDHKHYYGWENKQLVII